MFDLKAKLLAQGLVTKEQIDKLETKKSTTKVEFSSFDRKKSLAQLKAQNKSEQYITIRKWVDKNRLDKESAALKDWEKFFITTKDNQVTWLTLAKSVIEEISAGRASVISYMSNHGFTHAVVPRDIAEDVGEVFPEWIKVLNDLQ